MGILQPLPGPNIIKNPVPRPAHFVDAAHMDIVYSDTVVPGGVKSTLIMVDRKQDIHFCTHLLIVKVQQLLIHCNSLKLQLENYPINYTRISTQSYCPRKLPHGTIITIESY